VTKLAQDRADQLERNPDAVARELEVHPRRDVTKTGDFSRVVAAVVSKLLLRSAAVRCDPTGYGCPDIRLVTLQHEQGPGTTDDHR
jgi:hypothetical protein